MSREVAYRAIDFILSQPPLRPAIVIEFTGGEATLEMALVADITRYVKQSLSRLRYHPWQTACVFLLSTNGTTYGSDPVQQYLWENRFQAQAAITIDGTKEKNDANRILKN